jgi:hypothetical protein
MPLSNTTKQRARLATLDELRENILPVHIAPLPCAATLRRMLDRHGVRRLKANPTARGGGGPCYYCVADVEKMLQKSLLPGRLAPAQEGSGN